MSQTKQYFLSGIGGSGMLSLAILLREQGCVVAGSDRARDQGRTPDKFAWLEGQGITLFPQDGSGITSADQIVVASAAVEDTVPDMAKTREVGATRLTRAQLLAELFNAAPRSIAIGGTSGKSTTTGMAGWIATHAGLAPTIMNGAVMNNFARPDAPYLSAVGGKGDVFISEVDESDGSIVDFHATIAVINNIAFDHKTMEELREIFATFLGQAKRCVLNADDAETMALAKRVGPDQAMTFSLSDRGADVFADRIRPRPDGISFVAGVKADGNILPVDLKVPGRHNVANALAAMAACIAVGVDPEQAAEALGTFSGVKRRMELVGKANEITVIDDFAHNPDKITATLSTLHEFPGRLLVMFQPHGFGPLRLMRGQFIDCFAENLGEEDVLLMPEPVYYGGTTDKSVSSDDIALGITAKGRNATALATRDECGAWLHDLARPGDRIVIMGARDDTLSEFAADVLAKLA